MEGRVTRKGLATAGFALSAVLVLAASCDAAPPRASKAIAPPKPETTVKSAMAPKPESEPQLVAPHPSPRPEPAPGKPPARKKQPVRTASHGGSVAQNSRAYRYDNQPGLIGRGRVDGDDCGEACRYRAWFRDYNAWYQAYGRHTAEYPPAPPGPDVPPAFAGDRDAPRAAFRSGEARARYERDRLDPWHGYDGRDGPQNGY